MSYTLHQLCERFGGRVEGDATTPVGGVTTLAEAGDHELAPVLDSRYLPQAPKSQAAALLVDSGLASRLPGGHSLWVHDEPRLALAQTLELLYPEPQVEPTIHPTAVVASSAHVEDTACVEALAVVQDHACVGARTVVGPRAVIGRQARLGTDCLVGPGAMVLDRCRLGDRVRVGPGTVVGSDGFGFVPDREGARRVPQRGDVVVEDDVELGALVTVDRGTLGHTTIRRGTKVDNQVHLGHNVDVGPHAIIAAQTGLAGSVRLGAGVMAGGQVGVADHLVVGDGARLAARSGVVSDVPAGATYAGYPALPRHQWLRLWAKLGRLQGSHKEVET